jgi:hypothetical protein
MPSYVIQQTIQPGRDDTVIVETDEDHGTFRQCGPVTNDIAYYRGSVSGETDAECFAAINAILARDERRLARVFRPGDGEWSLEAVPLGLTANQVRFATHKAGQYHHGSLFDRSDYRVELL